MVAAPPWPGTLTSGRRHPREPSFIRPQLEREADAEDRGQLEHAHGHRVRRARSSPRWRGDRRDAPRARPRPHSRARRWQGRRCCARRSWGRCGRSTDPRDRGRGDDTAGRGPGAEVGDGPGGGERDLRRGRESFDDRGELRVEPVGWAGDFGAGPVRAGSRPKRCSGRRRRAGPAPIGLRAPRLGRGRWPRAGRRRRSPAGRSRPPAGRRSPGDAGCPRRTSPWRPTCWPPRGGPRRRSADRVEVPGPGRTPGPATRPPTPGAGPPATRPGSACGLRARPGSSRRARRRRGHRGRARARAPRSPARARRRWRRRADGSDQVGGFGDGRSGPPGRRAATHAQPPVGQEGGAGRGPEVAGASARSTASASSRTVTPVRAGDRLPEDAPHTRGLQAPAENVAAVGNVRRGDRSRSGGRCEPSSRPSPRGSRPVPRTRSGRRPSAPSSRPAAPAATYGVMPSDTRPAALASAILSLSRLVMTPRAQVADQPETAITFLGGRVRVRSRHGVGPE